MKGCLGLFCFLRLALLFLPFTLSVSLLAHEKGFLINSIEIEEYTAAIVTSIDATAIAILSIPNKQHTFDNTLKPWNRLCAQLSQTLDVLQELEVRYGEVASQRAEELYAYFMEIMQSHDLHEIFMNCSFDAFHNLELDSFERYIGARFLANNLNGPIYLYEYVEEHNPSEIPMETQIAEISYEILSEEADAVCIRNITTDDHAHGLYQTLKKRYSHFIYTPPSSVLHISNNHRKKGMLIASKRHKDAFDIFTVGSRGNDSGASCETGVSATWGGANGIQWEGYIKAEVHDDRGNYAEGQITQRNDGSGQVDVRGGHESTTK